MVRALLIIFVLAFSLPAYADESENGIFEFRDSDGNARLVVDCRELGNYSAQIEYEPVAGDVPYDERNFGSRLVTNIPEDFIGEFRFIDSDGNQILSNDTDAGFFRASIVAGLLVFDVQIYDPSLKGIVVVKNPDSIDHEVE